MAHVHVPRHASRFALLMVGIIIRLIGLVLMVEDIGVAALGGSFIIWSPALR